MFSSEKTCRRTSNHEHNSKWIKFLELLQSDKSRSNKSWKISCYSSLWCLPVCLSIWKPTCLCILPFYSFAVHTPFKKSTLTYLVGIFRINASRIVHISFIDKCFQLMFCSQKILRTSKMLETKLNHYYCSDNNFSNKFRK